MARMREILAVASVVTGERRGRLSGWQREDAIAAMQALGHSKTHIAWSLRLEPAALARIATRMGLKLHQHDQRLDEIGLLLVSYGVPLPLRGEDQIAAIRMLARQRLNAAQIARRLCVDKHETVTKCASRHDINLLPVNASWFVAQRFARIQAERDKQERREPNKQRRNDYGLAGAA